MNATTIAGIIVGGVVSIVTILAKRWPLGAPKQRRKSDAERLDAIRNEIMEEVRGDLAACRAESEVNRWRIDLLIRALQENDPPIPIPPAVFLDVRYDPETDRVIVVGRGKA